MFTIRVGACTFTNRLSFAGGSGTGGNAGKHRLSVELRN